MTISQHCQNRPVFTNDCYCIPAIMSAKRDGVYPWDSPALPGQEDCVFCIMYLYCVRVCRYARYSQPAATTSTHAPRMYLLFLAPQCRPRSPGKVQRPSIPLRNNPAEQYAREKRTAGDAFDESRIRTSLIYLVPINLAPRCSDIIAAG